MAGRVALIHQSMFQVSSQSMHQPLAPPPSMKVENPADLQADEIIRRHSAVLEKQRERRQGFLCMLRFATWETPVVCDLVIWERYPQNRSLHGHPILQCSLCAQKTIRASYFDSVPFALSFFSCSKDQST